MESCKPNKKKFRLDSCTSNSGASFDFNIKKIQISFDISVNTKEENEFFKRLTTENFTKKEFKKLLKLTI
jgi:hypothetical protein